MRSCLLGLLLLLPSSMSHAQDEAANSAVDSSIEPAARIRSEKPWGIGLGIGQIVLPVSGLGLNFHHNLSGALQIEAAFYRGQWDATALLDSNEIILDRFHVNTQLSLLGIKYFPGNSFYFALGLAARTIEFDLEAHSGNERIEEKLSATSLGLRLAIGNTWSLGNGLFLGGEWLGLVNPFQSSVATEIKATGNSSADIKQLEAAALEIVDALAEAVTINFMFHIGYHF